MSDFVKILSDLMVILNDHASKEHASGGSAREHASGGSAIATQG